MVRGHFVMVVSCKSCVCPSAHIPTEKVLTREKLGKIRVLPKRRACDAVKKLFILNVNHAKFKKKTDQNNSNDL